MGTYEDALDDETLKASKIISRTDQSQLVCDLYDVICTKCENGEKIDELNGIERYFYLAKTFDIIMNAGGISEFYKNSVGNFANETVDVLLELGLDVLALILDKGNSIFRNGIVPENEEERLLQMHEVDENDIMWLFDNLDYEYSMYHEDLDNVCLEYVITHKEAFM